MQLHGVGVGRAVAVGQAFHAVPTQRQPAREHHAGDAAAELHRADAALESVATEIADHAARSDPAARDMLSATAMMPRDPELRADIARRVEAGLTAERAVFEAFDAVRAMLAAAGGRTAESAVDLVDVQRRVIALLTGEALSGLPVSANPHVLIAADLAPAQFVTLDTATILAIVTERGGPTSHTAILARAAAIPALVGVAGALDIAEGSTVIVDAAAGTLTVDPDPEQLAAARALSPSPAQSATLAPPATAAPPAPPSPSATPDAAADPENATAVPNRAVSQTDQLHGALADGTRIPLLANLDAPQQSRQALELGAEGVGLFRSEIGYLDHAEAPTATQLRSGYQRLLEEFEGRPVMIRLFDSSADKPLRFLPGVEGQNPALGVKGLRALRAHDGVLGDQLAALAAAANASAADLWVMAPMVTDAEDAAWVVELGHRAGLARVGIVAEVPSVALCAAEVAEVVDFISIGTNDLTQYTLAADRTIAGLGAYQDAWHPAVLRLVRLLADAGAVYGKPVGVCGEAAADPELAAVLVGLGVTSLSMAPSALRDVRARLATVTLGQARARAGAALNARGAREARELAALA